MANKNIENNRLYRATEDMDLYCTFCRRFIGYVNILKGTIKIYCPKCKNWTIIDFDT